MSVHNPQRRLLLFGALAFLAGLTLAPPGHAGKPGGESPAGNIAYWADGHWTMDADGNNKQPSPGFGERSHLAHGDFVWHLGTWPHPVSGVIELALIREDGDLNSIVYTGIPDTSLTYLRWAKDDSFISFSGGPNLQSVGSEAGIYAATLDWSSGSPVLTSAFLPVVMGTVTLSGPEIAPWFDWSPDGSAVVYILYDDRHIGSPPIAYVRDLMFGQETPIAVTEDGMEWSPDGSRIALRIEGYYTSESGIYTVRPDGGGLTQLTAEGRSTDSSPVWSPDSLHIVFTRRKLTRSGVLAGDLLRIPAQGGKTVNLTSDMLSSNKYPVDWR